MSKFSLDVLQKRGFPFTQSNDSDVILGAAFGEDVALTRVGGDILVSHVDPIVGAIGDIGWLAVHVACNDVAAAGIPPRWLLLLVLVPRLEDEELLEQGRRVMAEVSVLPEALVLADNGVTAMHDVTRGGVLETLLEIAHLSGVSIELEFALLPVPSIVSRFAQAFQFDPLRMISSGTLAVTVPEARVIQVSKALKALGTPFAFVGRVVEGAGVHVLKDGMVIQHAEIRCEEDELARMWAVYPRNG
jgi:hydrogenase maturation factor